jgi:hypothetical protein
MTDFISITITDLVAIPIIGALLSLFFQLVKDKFGSNSFGNKMAIIALSILIGAIYYLFRETPIFITIVGILGTASTVYALFVPKN